MELPRSRELEDRSQRGEPRIDLVWIPHDQDGHPFRVEVVPDRGLDVFGRDLSEAFEVAFQPSVWQPLCSEDHSP